MDIIHHRASRGHVETLPELRRSTRSGRAVRPLRQRLEFLQEGGLHLRRRLGLEPGREPSVIAFARSHRRAKEALRLLGAEAGKPGCLIVGGEAVRRLDVSGDVSRQLRRQTEADMNGLEQPTLEGRVVEADGRLEGADQVADDVLGGIVQQRRQPPALRPLRPSRTNNVLHEKRMLADRERVTAGGRHGNKELYFIKFDPLTNPEMATGADQVSNRLVYALGYHVPENYLVEFSRETLVLGKEVMLADRLGRKRPMSGRDLTELMLKVPKNKRGHYRATASRVIPGKGIGPYRYHGVRSDDPNDFVPHEHRRDLRGFAIVSAWIGHDDSRAVNTYDALVEENGEKFIRHYILDLGSTLGSGTQRANSPRSGGEYLFGWKQSAVQLFSLGFAIPNWARASFPDLPSIGRFESARFDPERWVPEYPNPAFLNRRADDEFWAAKQILSLRDQEIRAIVNSGEYSDPKAAEWLARCLIERRDKIGRAFYRKVLPVDKFQIDNNRLGFQDLSEKAGFGSAGPYEVEWLELNKSTGPAALIQGATGPTVPFLSKPYVVARIASTNRPSQFVEVTVHRSTNSSPTIVAINRRW